MVFYYYGTDKGLCRTSVLFIAVTLFVEYIRASSLCLPCSVDKHQKGSLYLSDYDVQLVNNLRKDSKKNSCFELFAPGRRSFQVSVSHNVFAHGLFTISIFSVVQIT